MWDFSKQRQLKHLDRCNIFFNCKNVLYRRKKLTIKRSDMKITQGLMYQKHFFCFHCFLHFEYMLFKETLWEKRYLLESRDNQYPKLTQNKQKFFERTNKIDKLIECKNTLPITEMEKEESKQRLKLFLNHNKIMFNIMPII